MKNSDKKESSGQPNEKNCLSQSSRRSKDVAMLILNTIVIAVSFIILIFEINITKYFYIIPLYVFMVFLILSNIINVAPSCSSKKSSLTKEKLLSLSCNMATMATITVGSTFYAISLYEDNSYAWKPVVSITILSGIIALMNISYLFMLSFKGEGCEKETTTTKDAIGLLIIFLCLLFYPAYSFVSHPKSFLPYASKTYKIRDINLNEEKIDECTVNTVNKQFKEKCLMIKRDEN